ncbi:MAG: redox-sensing transcriptional repressor Rex [bacterium]
MGKGKYSKKSIVCWEYHHCKRANCKAYGKTEVKCWLITGTKCHTGEEDLSEQDKFNRYCAVCTVYRSFAKKTPPGSLVRLALYCQTVRNIHNQGVKTISSRYLGNLLRVKPSQVRKDLSEFNITGESGFGYNTKALENDLCKALKVEKVPVVLIGSGDWAQTLINEPAFKEQRPFFIKEIFAPTYNLKEKTLNNFKILPLSKLLPYINKKDIQVAIIATSGTQVKNIVEILNNSSVRIILNFSSMRLEANPGIKVFDFNLQVKLGIVCFYLHNPDLPVLPEHALL